MREIFEKIPGEFISKTATYDQKVPIVSILEDIDRLGIVVVTNNGEYMGIVDQRAIARKGSLKLEDKYACGKFAQRVPILNDSTSITDAMGYFYSASSKALPYMKGSRIVGIVKRSSMLKAILSMHLLSKTKVNAIMSSPVITIDLNANMAQAQKLMYDNNINRLVVLENGRLYGLLTHKNIVKFGARSESGSKRQILSTKPAQVRISDICTRAPISVEYDAGVEEAIRQLIIRDISSIVVIRSGKPVGMLSVRDVVESVAQSWNKKEAEILITGLSQKTEEYSGEIRTSLEELSGRIDKFARMNVKYLALNVKDIKTNTYELKARLGLDKLGVVYASATGHTIDKTLKDLEAKLYKVIKEKKEFMVTSTKEADSTYEIDES